MAVWSYQPQETLTETLASPVRATEVAPGSVVTGRVASTFLREWRLRHTLVETATVTSMAAFFDAQQGPFLAFQWTNPNDATTYTVRFGSGMSRDLFEPGRIRLGEVVLTQVTS